MLVHEFFAVRPAGACQAACLKASYTFAILQEYGVQIAVLKKGVHMHWEESSVFAVQFRGQH